MDRYPRLGMKRSADSLEDALAKVRREWPTADFEGSTGFERSSAVRVDGIEWLVAHSWMTRSGRWWVRIATMDTRIAI